MYANQEYQLQTTVQPIGTTASIADLKHMPNNITRGKNYVIRCSMDLLSTATPWDYTVHAQCNQIALENGTLWFCPTHADTEDIKNMYRLQETISDQTDTIDVTIFDRAATQLLKIPCSNMLSSPNNDSLLQAIRYKDLQLQVQPQRDKKTGIVRCTVSNAAFIETAPNTEVTPAANTATNTPAPLTPAVYRTRNTSGKRLFLDTRRRNLSIEKSQSAGYQQVAVNARSPYVIKISAPTPFCNHLLL